MKSFYKFSYFLIPLFFFLLLYGVFSYTQNVKKVMQKESLLSIESKTPSLYPFLTFPPLSQNQDPILSAFASVVMEDGSHVVVYQKNGDVRLPMASTTKIMTALVALDHFNMDDVLTVYSTSVPPAVVGFSLGEQVRFKDMLYGMLLGSGNDAALAIAQNYPGGEIAFVAAMNNKALELSLANTHFIDSSGLSPENSTSPIDLARLSSLAMNNTTIRAIVGTKYATISSADGSVIYPLTNLNKLLGSNGVIGIKTGFTDEAGEVLATVQEQNGHRYIVVVMKSEDRFFDTNELLSFVSKNISFKAF